MFNDDDDDEDGGKSFMIGKGGGANKQGKSKP